MRWIAGTLVMMAAISASAAPPSKLTADVAYSFVDQNGVGWVTVDGAVTVTLAFAFKTKDGSLVISGVRRTNDGVLVAGKPGGPPDMKTTKSETDKDETYPLHDVAVAGATITFKLDPSQDHLDGTCAPAKVTGLSSATLYECTITGFHWHPVANLPAVHHPFIAESNPSAKLRILNTLSGASKTGFGQRKVSETKPPAKPAPKP